MNIRKHIALLLAVIMTACLFAGCKPAETEIVSKDPVTLTVVGSWEDCKALDDTVALFNAKYPNCTINYEYLQDYYASLEVRLADNNNVDLFFTTAIQEGSALLPYSLDLLGCEGLDLSDTFDGLIKNFTYRQADGSDSSMMYAIPLGAEMRGIYVNKTLLASLGLDVPTNQATLLAACAKLKENGYIAFHDNPGNFAQLLVYPWISNTIANADDYAAACATVEARNADTAEMIREPLEFLYTLVEEDYYDYKTAQDKLNLFKDSAAEDCARYFLSIKESGDSYVKADDLGQIAFMPGPISMRSTIDKTKDDYHSAIDYTFIPAPVGEEGGYAYLSPAHGIAANKNSANVEWSIRFLDFLFTPENNEVFAEEFNVIPNTKEAFAYIKTLYDIPEDRICELGQVTFSYDYYGIVCKTLVNISKANNPKYMQADPKGTVTNSDGETVSLYPLDYYIDQLKEGIIGQ